jgi:hypothetical protein
MANEYRVTGAVYEIFSPSSLGNARVSLSAAEVFHVGVPAARVSNTAIEVFMSLTLAVTNLTQGRFFVTD